MSASSKYLTMREPTVGDGRCSRTVHVVQSTGVRAQRNTLGGDDQIRGEMKGIADDWHLIDSRETICVRGGRCIWGDCDMTEKRECGVSVLTQG